MMTFDQAQEAFINAVEQQNYGMGRVMLPSKAISNQDKNGRWILRNCRGFLAYVTSTGKVLDEKCQRIGDEGV